MLYPLVLLLADSFRNPMHVCWEHTHARYTYAFYWGDWPSASEAYCVVLLANSHMMNMRFGNPITFNRRAVQQDFWWCTQRRCFLLCSSYQQPILLFWPSVWPEKPLAVNPILLEISAKLLAYTQGTGLCLRCRTYNFCLSSYFLNSILLYCLPPIDKYLTSFKDRLSV